MEGSACRFLHRLIWLIFLHGTTITLIILIRMEMVLIMIKHQRKGHCVATIAWQMLHQHIKKLKTYLSINIELYHVTILTLISIMYNRCCTPPHMKGSARTYSWLIATSTARKYHSINSTRTTVELQYDRALQYECVKQNTKGRRRKGRHGRLPQDGAIFR